MIHDVVNIFRFANSCDLIANFAVLCDLERGPENDGCCYCCGFSLNLT